MEELPAARPEPRDHVLDVRSGSGSGADRRRVERTAADGKRGEEHDPARDLEPPAGDVLVGDSIAGDVQRRADQKRGEARAGEMPGDGAGGDVERDDHGHLPAR
jgi:hypothetical protein